MKPLLLAACLTLAGCNACDYDGYQPLTVALVAGAPASASTPDGCAIYTDIPHDGNPDQYRDKLAFIGQSAYECLTGTAANAVTSVGGEFYSETLWFRIDGFCKNTYQCFNSECRKIDSNLAHIGPQEECIGRGMGEWSEVCWGQFYAGLGHEIMHGWLGEFHA